MSIINLENRITTDSEIYENNRKSAKSYILISDMPSFDNGNKETLILNVGDNYIQDSQKIAIPENGYVVKPGKSVLFETEQKISTPLNVIGVIYGIGTNIFNGGFISAGKIDQGFSDNLKIGFYNAGKHNITFKKGNALASAIFYETEDTMLAVAPERQYERLPVYNMKRIDKVKGYFSDNWLSLVSLAIAAGTLIFEIFSK